jgi:hypothetical protein
MMAEISFDLVMEDEMSFVEGANRLSGGEWQVFIFTKLDAVEHVQVTPGKWDSGTTGVLVRIPASKKLNKAVVQTILSDALHVTEWVDVAGPDSMRLR